jgi:hypothetical protein
MRSYAESTRPLAQTAGQSVKKHWKHYLGFVACLLVLALATPLFTHLPEIINSFAAGWGEGSGQPFDTTDFLLDTTDSLNETTERPKFEQPETSQALTEPEETTEEKKNEVLDVSPVYWHFIPELEAISTEEMLAVQKAWETYSCEVQRDWYYNVYTKNYGGEDGYTEEKILEMVNNSVEEFYQSLFVKDKNNYFHSRRFRSKGYLGKFSECIVLYDVADSRVTYDRQPQMIGQHDIYYDVYYVYKDGKIYTLQEAYTLGYITDEHMPKIMERKEIYKPLALSYAPSDYESIKDINKSNVTE